MWLRAPSDRAISDTALSPAATGLRSRHKVLGQLPTYWWLIIAKPSSHLHGFLTLIFAKRLVRIAVQPALAGLGGRDDRMFGGVRVFARVPVRRAVTAECHAALLTRAQMHPLRADLHAFSAFAVFRLLNRRDRVEMRTTSVRHHLILAVLDERRRRQWILRPPPKRLV